VSRIWKGGLVCDLEDFDFLHCEIVRTRENSHAVQVGVVRVRVVKRTVTVGVCVAVIGNTNVTKAWTPLGATPDCFVLPFGHQRKFPRREIARILQRKKKTVQRKNKTPQTPIGLPSVA
jgi:hypothetical protein